MEAPWIASAEAAPALAFAADAQDRDPLRLGAALERRFGLTPEQRSAVLTQAELRARAAGRWRTATDHLLFTRDGLEQATRPALAAWRADRLRAFGVAVIADLGCGLGFESRAFATAGMRVHAVELDADTAALAAANLRGLDATVTLGDVTDPDVLAAALHGVDAVFLDPARRDPAAPRSVDGLSGHRATAPESWSPPWSWITALGARLPRTVVKVAPGIEHALIPADASATWATVDGDLVEASIWCSGFEDQPGRAAVAIEGGAVHRLDSTMPTSDSVTGVAGYLIDCAPVVTRSGLVTTLAASLGATRIDEHIGYLTTDTAPAASPFATVYRVLDVMPFERKRVARALAGLDCGGLTVMKRGYAGDTEALRRAWLQHCRGRRQLVVALTRIGDEHTAVICELQT